MGKLLRTICRTWYLRLPAELAALLAIWFFVIQYRPTLGPSMMPTLADGSYVFIDKLSYRFRAPARGDVIVFQSNEKPRMLYCKRVIALPGETIEIREGQVHIDEVPLHEPYVIGNTFWELPPLRVGERQVYAIGDNRGMSIKDHFQGLVAWRNILGRVIGKGHTYTGEKR